jgi:hypothetical protein
MPYPNEHACRLHPPTGSDFARKNASRSHNGKAYDVIYQKTAEGTMQEQAFRYPKSSWSVEEARGHCASHGGSFEAAAIELSKDLILRMLKSVDEEQVVYGIVFEPDFVDAHDQFVQKDDIRLACHAYMAKLQRECSASRTKLSHEINIGNVTDIVECYLAPCDFESNGMMVKEGTWVVAMKVYDKDLWEATKKEIKGFSPGGYLSYAEGE